MRIIATPSTENGRAVLRRMAEAARGGQNPGTRAFVVEVAAATLRVIMRLSASEALDTGRYIRAWQQAYNDLPGVQPVPLVNLTPGRRGGQIRAQLAKQARYWLDAKAKMEQDYAGVLARPALRYYRKTWRIWRRYEKIRTLASRSAQQLRLLSLAGEDAPVIRIGGRGQRSVDRPNLTSLTRVFTKPYGGYSAVQPLMRGWIVRCINREPHARIVESGMTKKARDESGRDITVRAPAKRILQRGVMTARSAGLPPLSGRQFTKILAAAGRAARAGRRRGV